MGDLDSERDPETLALFIEESLEGLQRIERLLLLAEHGTLQPDAISTVFRDIHTIKGTSGFLALKKVLGLSHAAENLLSLLRDKTLEPRRDHFATLLLVGDTLRRLIDRVREHNDEGDIDVEPLVAELKAMLTPAAADAAETEAVPIKLVGAQQLDSAPPPPAASPKLGEILVNKHLITQAQLDEGLREQQALVSASKADAADSTIRVNVAVLDRLVNLIGELVLARNQLVQVVKVQRESSSTTQAAFQRLNLVTSDLQESIMKTRMQPIARVFEKIPRMVRDLSNSTGKQVTTQIDGTSTEIDRALIEAIRDPVMHIIRNAIDHGIEMPETRTAQGKPAAGKLSVRASHQGGMVSIEVEDDGRGMDPKVLRAHAVKKGILPLEEANRLNDREALELVFRPGFSTASAVTDISGRGVGMDVVRTHVERAGGQVELDSVVGAGTTIRLKMPLTLAIIPALLVKAGKQRFAIPQVNLLELVHLDEEQSQRGIENVRGALVHRLRGEILPLVRLDEALGMNSGPRSAEPAPTNIVVVAVGARRYGLIVDAIQDTEEIVIKPLHGQLKRLACYSGATVLGNGDVALILEVGGVAVRAGIDLNTQREVKEIKVSTTVDNHRHSFVIFNAGDGAQCAVPLAVVARLEQIPTSQIERIAGAEVVQYRDTIMPIIRLESVLPLKQAAVEKLEQTLLVFDFGHRVGLAVEQILDIVEVPQGGESDSSQGEDPLTLGTCVVAGKTTLLLDVYQLVRKLAPQFVRERRKGGPRHRLLLVDDSTAMRAAVGGFLRARGYDIVEAAGGEAALRELRSAKGARVDAVITDVEMPGIDGYGLIETIHAEREALPVIAWTFHEDSAVVERAVALGARACINKLKREELLSALQALGLSKRSADAGRAA